MPHFFRPRPQDDFGRYDRQDDERWDARDRRHDETPSWTEGDGGRTAEAWRNPGSGSGQYARDAAPDRYRDYGSDRYSDYRGSRAEASRERYSDPSSRYGHDSREPGGSWSREPDRRYRRSSSDYGYDASGRPNYPDNGYAPGAQIWKGSDRDFDSGRSTRSQHDFEPDYLHWRDQQLSGFDRDYSDWRSERREKFSADFDTWRSSRPRVQAENPIVGDVSDGGTGDASELKKR